MTHRRINSRGFTLIELLLYTSLLGIIVLLVSMAIATVLATRVKNQTIGEVEQQGQQVLQYMTQVARNAEVITAPLAGTSASSLTLDVVAVAKDPTIIDLSAGTLRTKEGAAATIPLTNAQVTASALTFTNLSRTGTPGTIRIQFTLAHINPSGRNEFSFSKTFYASASLRSP